MKTENDSVNKIIAKMVKSFSESLEQELKKYIDVNSKNIDALETDSERYVSDYLELLEKYELVKNEYSDLKREVRSENSRESNIMRTKLLSELYRHKNVIQKSGLFDKDEYLDKNPDVKESGVDPILHYLEFGYLENRHLIECFDTKRYLEINKDIELAKINPILHYVLYGKNEKRKSR